MGLPLTTRIVLSLRALLFGYLTGLVVLQALRLLRFWYFGFLPLDFASQAFLFALMTLLGWLLFLLPFVVNENPTRTFHRSFNSAVVGGMAGSCLLLLLLLSLLGRSAFVWPNYARVCIGYSLCAFAIGSVATGLYVVFRNQKELGGRMCGAPGSRRAPPLLER
jgi:hypothetical protein